jgi:hypothetical protein
MDIPRAGFKNFYVCRESRAEALRRYGLCFEIGTGIRKGEVEEKGVAGTIYLDPSRICTLKTPSLHL